MNTTIRDTVATTTAPSPARAIAMSEDGQPVQFFYDLPCFVSVGFTRATDAIDYWVGKYTEDARAEGREHADQSHAPKAGLMTSLNMVRPSVGLGLAETFTVTAAVREVLEHTVVEVHGLAPTDRGHYLAQLLTRWFSDGHMDWLRFRLGHLLATYYSAMPASGECLGLFEVPGKYEELTVVGWRTAHGVYFDLVHLYRPLDDFLSVEVEAVLASGRQEEPDTFAGVRYLPLDALHDARLYAPDGSWESAVERDCVSWLDVVLSGQQP